MSEVRRRVPLIALALAVLIELLLHIPPPFPTTDHLVFWQAGRTVASGGSPYDPGIWAHVAHTYQSEHLLPFVEAGRPVWIYPAWTAFLFVPFGILPYPVGPWLLHLAYLGAGLLAAVLFIRSLPMRWQSGAEPGLVLVASFLPLVIADRNGQAGTFLLFGLVLVHRGLQARSITALVGGSLLLFAKPQLSLVVAAVVLGVLFVRRDRRSVGVVSSALLLVAAASTLRYPDSLSVAGAGVTDRVGIQFGAHASTWVLAQFLAGAWWPVVGVALVASACVACVVAVRSLPGDLRPAGLIASAAILSLAITPVISHYDEVPLVLALIVALAVGRRRSQQLLTWLVAILVPWVLFIAEISWRPEVPPLGGIVPLLVAAAFATVAVATSDAARRAGPATG